MDGLLRNCATGCRVDEAFTMDDLVDSISADTSGLRCGHVQLRIVFITPNEYPMKQTGTRKQRREGQSRNIQHEKQRDKHQDSKQRSDKHEMKDKALNWPVVMIHSCR
ncbi:hypothetical protein DPX16_23883 [Anabarilius grahami]|uniref:Uncharacterized protein n=1 Tax=Anabarilius grahami TaxID=495550 RepID=A0A3N0YXE7_ANAGA|nr:hypothetical protein DPX16_23883 [Anabarilius grahami]